MFKKLMTKIFGKKTSGYISAKDVRDMYHTHFSGRVCNICKEEYVGVAQDCKCTNPEDYE